METAMSKTISYSVTSGSESYFHLLAIMIPKVYSTKGAQYELKEAVAFLAYHSKRHEFVAMMKKLVVHKYAATLHASNSQKGGQNQSYVLDALAELFPGDAATMNYVKKRRARVASLIEKRLETQSSQRATVAQSDCLAQFKLMPDAADTTGEIQQKVQVEGCPRTVPPFPFKRDDIITPEKLALLRQCWSHTGDIKAIHERNKAKKHLGGCDDDDNDDGDDDDDDDDEDENHVDSDVLEPR
jgi:hypothetical protein